MEIIGYNTNDGYEYEFLVCGQMDNTDNLLFIGAFEYYEDAHDFVKTVRNGRIVHNIRVSHKRKI